jgi:hypothetical protein
VVGVVTFSAFWLLEGLKGQGAYLTLSLIVDDVEVSGHVEMAGCVVHAHPRLPSSWRKLFSTTFQVCGKQAMDGIL